MIELLIEYGDIYKDANLIYQALKLMILSGESKMFSDVLETYWNDVSDVLAVNADNLWSLTDEQYCINNEIMKCLIIKTLGQYMSNSFFRKAMIFLLKYSQEFKNHVEGVSLLDAINNNLKRITNEFVLDMLLNILKSEKLRIYSKVTDLLSDIDLLNCEDSDIISLSNLIKEKMTIILENNGTPYFIINLLRQRKDNFIQLYTWMQKEIPNSQLELIDIELGENKKVEKILVDSITKLEDRFIPNSCIQTMYADDPLDTIITIIKKFKMPDLMTILNEKFVPLAIKILSSDDLLETKESYLKALITLLVEYKKESQEIPSEVKTFFLSNKVELNCKFSMIQASVTSSIYYLNTINSLLGINAENNIFSTCIGYKEKSKNERETFSYSIQKYIEFNLISNNIIPRFINLIVLELLRDSYFVVRKNAIKCLMLLYKIESSEFLKGELIHMTLDTSPNVKGYYVSLLKECIINENDTKELLNLFSRDASYNVRESSREIR